MESPLQFVGGFFCTLFNDCTLSLLNLSTMKNVALTLTVLAGISCYAQDESVMDREEESKVEFTSTGSVTSYTDSGLIILEDGGMVTSFYNLKYIEATGIIEINPKSHSLIAHGVTKLDWYRAPLIHISKENFGSNEEHSSMVVEYTSSGEVHVSFE